MERMTRNPAQASAELSSLRSELTRLRVIEREHGEFVRDLVDTIVKSKQPIDYGVWTKIDRENDRLTTPAKAEGEGDIKVKLWGNTAAPGQPGAAP